MPENIQIKPKLVMRGQLDICSRYRPRKFSEVIGNENILKALKRTIDLGNKRSKAYLFLGDSGVGKTTVARIMAMGLNCEKGDTVEPCLECENCKNALQGNAMHIQEMDSTRVNTKDGAGKVVDDMNMSTFTGRNKIYLFDEAHAFTEAAQNVLLKPIEEPPPDTYIFFCTTEENKIIEPLRKRFVKYTFKNPPLKEKVQALLDIWTQEDFKSRGWLIKKEDLNEFLKRIRNKSLRDTFHDFNTFLMGGIDLIEIPEDLEGYESDTGNIPLLIEIGNVLEAFKALKEQKKSKNFTSERVKQGLLKYFSRKMLKADTEIEAMATSKIMSCFMYDSEKTKTGELSPYLVKAVCDACAMIKKKKR